MENTLTVNALTIRYLNWCEKHRAPRSCEWYRNYLKSFLSHPGISDLQVTAMKPFHVSEWVDSHSNWGPTYSRGAMVAIQRMCNWAVEEGHIEITPIAKLRKPTSKNRDTFLTPNEYTEFLKLINEHDPFRILVIFSWITGARPQETRNIEPRHVELDKERIVFPIEESKGKRKKRIIYLHGEALEIIQKLMLERQDDGKLFRNKRGTAWSKWAICNRMVELSKRFGRRIFIYALRHSFATRKLIQGHDSITIAKLMGHADTMMLNRVYAHIDKDIDHLKRALAD